MAQQFLPDIFGRRSGGSDIFRSLQREIDQVFNEFSRGMPMFAERGNGGMGMMGGVKLNVAETDKAVEVTAELPGVDPKDIDVQLKDDILTIKGEKKTEKEDKQKNYHLVEHSYGSFERSFALPCEVQADKVEASFDKGVLKITLPKSPESQPKTRKIEVKNAA
jgi:HSP20 family protein